MAPKGILKLNAFEMTHGRPLVTTDLVFDEETHKLVSHIVSLSQVQWALPEYRNEVLPTPTKG